MAKLQALVCTECGGHIDRDTMTCRYCGIQYKLDQDMMPIMVSRFDPHMETLKARIFIPDYVVKAEMGRGADMTKLTEYAVKDLSRKLAEAIVPFMEVRTNYEPCEQIHEFSARVRVYRPDYRFGE